MARRDQDRRVQVVRVDRLLLDQENHRVAPSKDQRSAVRAVVEHQGAKLLELAHDIILNGLSPIDLLLVMPAKGQKGQYTVLEGNRRLTALRVLDTPELADGAWPRTGPTSQKKLVSYSKRYHAAPISEIPCVVIESRDAAKLWVDRRHRTDQGGRGLELWDALGQSRADAAEGRERRWRKARAFIEEAGPLDPELARWVEKRSTTLDRILTGRAVREVLGVEMGGARPEFANCTPDQGREVLLGIFRLVTDKKAGAVDRFKSTDQIRAELAALVPLLTQPPTVQTSTLAPPPPASKPKRARGGAAVSERACLAGSEAVQPLPSSNERLGRLIRECRSLDTTQFPEAASLVLRVLVELSTEQFLEVNGIPPKAPAKSWSDKGPKLQDKLHVAFRRMDPGDVDDTLKAVRRKDPDNIANIDALHEYVHRRTTIPVGTELRVIWDRWYPYLARALGPPCPALPPDGMPTELADSADVE